MESIDSWCIRVEMECRLPPGSPVVHNGGRFGRSTLDGLPTAGCALQGSDEGSLDSALNRALDAWYNDRPWFHSLAKRCMLQVRYFHRCCSRPHIALTGCGMASALL